jgi:hypothetical protein
MLIEFNVADVYTSPISCSENLDITDSIKKVSNKMISNKRFSCDVFLKRGVWILLNLRSDMRMNQTEEESI